jgi:transcriptional regulator with XRE-family HTH domain
MSQEALAFASNVTASTLSRIERGLHHPTLSTLTRIAQALGVPPAELIAAADMDAGRTPNAES